jgi:hypothetical protein
MGAPERHFQTVIEQPAEVTDVFVEWSRHDPAFSAGHEWQVLAM